MNLDKFKINSKSDLKKCEDLLLLQEEMFTQTAAWWQKRADNLTAKMESFNKNPQFDEGIGKFLEGERIHLNLKSQWELRELERIKQLSSIIDSYKEKNFFANLGKVLSNKKKNN